MNKTLSIQGFQGSFHQLAARQFFGESVNVKCCSTFREVLQNATSPQCDGGVMAIENSIAGSILPNYTLLQKFNVRITGEVYLHVRQNLLVNHGVNLEDIREVHSHPMALLQCSDFLEKHNWKLIETEDTALSARHLQQHRSKHIAAVAGTLAAELFNLKVIAPNIHTLKNNYTRFLVLQPTGKAMKVENPDKASIIFQTDHSKGSLAKVLTVIAAGGINLSKLQSMPIPGSDWRYAFHADMEFSSLDQFQGVIADIESLTIELKTYGVYKNGRETKKDKTT